MEVNLQNLKPDVRYLKEMENVIYDKEWFKATSNFELYYMYHGIKEENGNRYDITTIPVHMLGKEFPKTKGHYHVGKYPEVYTVLEGNAIYLMQKRKNGTENEIGDVYVVECQKGDVIIILSDYGHVTINPSQAIQLKMANWISSKCKSDYSLFEKFQGACYYYVKSATADGGASWIKNEHYKNVPPLRFEEPLKSVPENLDFLKVK